ncbi:MAG: zinc ABC transporter substrate-binding protein [Chloroflexi bacterium]|nr:zinc ABC transporter substrate-binding protein [Chloroflexota bacterium]
MPIRQPVTPLLILLLLFGLSACRPTPTTGPADAAPPLQVVVTTSIVGDVVQRIGGDAIDVQVLMPAGVDPHSFEPTPRQVAAMSDADLIFSHGLNLEETMAPLLHSMAAEQKRIVAVAAGVQIIAVADAPDGIDPHTWMDPNNVLVWVDAITQALSEADPAHASYFEGNAEAYRQQLHQLDAWIRQQVATIPPARRQIVTDHLIFSYFARRYGFEQIGAIMPATSSLAGSSAQALSQLEDIIRSSGVPSIFVGNTVNPDVAQRVAQDTGVRLIKIYTGSLSPADGPAATYLDYMRYDTRQIVQGLR